MKAQSDTRKCLLLHRWSAPAWQSHYLYQQWFTKLTSYEFDDIVGRKCRFLQGEKTSPTDEKRISDALKSEKECSVNLLNYKKDGTEFVNEVSFIAAKSFKLAYGLFSCLVTTNHHQVYLNYLHKTQHMHTVLLDTTENTKSRTGLLHWSSSCCSEWRSWSDALESRLGLHIGKSCLRALGYRKDYSCSVQIRRNEKWSHWTRKYESQSKE